MGSTIAIQGSGILETLAATLGPVPRVLLCDTKSDGVWEPVERPGSTEMPAADERVGRMQLLGEIARGGMGAVLKGRDPDLGRDLAVKVLLMAHQDKPDLVRRFIEEAQIAGQLQHPGIVPVYDLGTFADQRPYFSMKLVKGRTLAELLADRASPAQDIPRVLGILEAVCQTIAYAHARGVIHRDLKPSNIMVGSFGEVQVMDWGLAKVLSRGGVRHDGLAGRADSAGQETLIATSRGGSDPDLSRPGEIMGTPSYMAPEQAWGENDAVDERADVFALGSILCEILTGRPAFLGRSSGEILACARRADLTEALGRLQACGADAEMIELARSCLCREPENRLRDGGAIAERMRAYFSGVQDRLRAAEIARATEEARAVEARRATAAAEAQVRAERRARRLQVGLAASLLGLVTLGFGGYSWTRRQPAERTTRTARAVEDALADAARFRGEAQADPSGNTAKWGEAHSAAKRAVDLLTQGEGNPQLLGRVNLVTAQIDREWAAVEGRARRMAVDRALLSDLESIRGGRDEHGDPVKADADYAAAFQRAGLDPDSAEAGRWIAARSEPVELAAYLDDWAFVRKAAKRSRAEWRRLVDTARTADPDPWRDALRAKISGEDSAVLTEFRRLADDTAALDAQPVTSQVLLARHLKNGAGDLDRAERVLRRAASRHPDDFWVHLDLAMAPGAITGGLGELVPRPEESVRHLTAATAIRPKSISAHQALGVALHAQGKLDEAATELGEAVRLNPRNPGTHINLGNALKAQGKLDAAVAEFREAIRLQPRDVMARNNLGAVLRNQEKLEESAAELHEAIKLDGEYFSAHDNLGRTLQAQGKLDAAVAEFREAVRLSPNKSDLHLDLGAALYAQRKFDEAGAEFREANRLRPSDHYPHEWLGLALEGLGDHERAIAEFREVIRLKPDYARGYILLVDLLRGQGRLDEAEKVGRQGLTGLGTQVDEIHIGLSHTLQLMGRFDEATEESRKAIGLQPEDFWHHFFLLQRLRLAGQSDVVVPVYRDAVLARPTEALARIKYAVALRQVGRTTDAIVEAQDAVRLDPNSGDVLRMLAWLLLSDRDWDRAVPAYSKLFEIGQDDPWIRHDYGMALRAHGDLDEAIAEFRRGRKQALSVHTVGTEIDTNMAIAERQKLIVARLAGVVRGDDRPRDAHETLDFAILCYDRNLYAAAARLYAVAFEADPQLAEDLTSRRRYDAACNAALAASDRSHAEPPLDEAARSRLRGQALAWLKADLASLGRLTEVGTPKARAEVRERLYDWKFGKLGPDLAVVRNPDALAKLPETERKDWEALWAAVQALIKRAQE